MLDRGLLIDFFKGKVTSLEEYLVIQKIKDWEITDDGCVIIRSNAKFIGVRDKLPITIIEMHGDLDLSNNLITDVSNLPEVKGNLNLSFNSIKDLSNMPNVQGDLDLSRNSIIDLKGVNCSGGIKLNNNARLVSLEGLPEVIGGDVVTNYCSLTSLNFGRETIINGDLTCGFNRITSLITNHQLTVQGNLSLSNNLIRNTDYNVKYKTIDLSGNPCKASDEWETDCVW